jgi:hypothetical protein
MTTSSGRKHAGTGSSSDQIPVPEPTFAERARTLVCLGRVGSLSTLSRRQPGFRLGSVMPYGLDDHGLPIFLISTQKGHSAPGRQCPDSRRLLFVSGIAVKGRPPDGFTRT